MAESPSQSPPRVSVSETEEDYWCYHCDKRVSVETVANLPDVVCFDCKNGFVVSISHHDPPSDAPPSSDPHGSPFLQVLRLIAQAARNEHAPSLPPPPNDANDDDFLRIELGGWDNDDDDEEEEENAHSVELHNDDDAVADEEDDVRSAGEVDEPDEVDRRLRGGRDILRLRLRDFAAARPRGGGQNEVLDWAEILLGLEDNSIELRFEMPESDSYVGNPEDYVDADDRYEALLQRLAESDGRRGAPPASKAAVAELPAVDEALVCAICKDMVNAGVDESKKMPCGHGYHGDCIVPWLSTRNSCPVCRYEMPTDDPEYEEERSKFDVNVRAGASGSGGVDSLSG